MPKFKVINPTTVAEAINAVQQSENTRFVAGGTDINPNLKHRLLEPDFLVALNGVQELFGISENSDGIRIGAMESLTNIESSSLIQQLAPGLASAALQVSGPQLRNMGTIGGNVMLDTRCQWYNQTYFWRKSLGFCLKKDGDVCHVIKGGSKCVAAASNDTAAALSTLQAELEFVNDQGSTRISIDKLWQADGVWNKKVSPKDLLVAIYLPASVLNQNGCYQKLRDRNSIDFPLLGIAARISHKDKVINDCALCVVALQARPWPLSKASALLIGTTIGSDEFKHALDECCALAAKQCRPMPNIPGDDAYRHAMVPVFTRRAIMSCLEQV
ncbi:MAG: FAD binding domain-containing protein [Planctomycetes bacterium]|nr:FAD binding domain-containing protein [Planctomycetota bacterium]